MPPIWLSYSCRVVKRAYLHSKPFIADLSLRLLTPGVATVALRVTDPRWRSLMERDHNVRYAVKQNGGFVCNPGKLCYEANPTTFEHRPEENCIFGINKKFGTPLQMVTGELSEGPLRIIGYFPLIRRGFLISQSRVHHLRDSTHPHSVSDKLLRERQLNSWHHWPTINNDPINRTTCQAPMVPWMQIAEDFGRKKRYDLFSVRQVLATIRQANMMANGGK
ncbi:hypothetical protein CAPTEDRAFT_200097 [Capitella teleta]|uniref:Uncharacterized protein n=1 Tax=Capitella teleta TaxID=283909 RepID=R7USJ9_CAPTE|nr:hypothetical protein CAPTEDRAFT_200097 [Capitella teleta]|eukprot:ELU09093.1 hypothetical protein CAPTEDRAFT_200097 [Capitella teleta]